VYKQDKNEQELRFKNETDQDTEVLIKNSKTSKTLVKHRLLSNSEIKISPFWGEMEVDIKVNNPINSECSIDRLRFTLQCLQSVLFTITPNSCHRNSYKLGDDSTLYQFIVIDQTNLFGANIAIINADTVLHDASFIFDGSRNELGFNFTETQLDTETKIILYSNSITSSCQVPSDGNYLVLGYIETDNLKQYVENRPNLLPRIFIFSQGNNIDCTNCTTNQPCGVKLSFVGA